MAATAERQMNLAALQQRDPYITAIVDTASQVALYCFNAQGNEWEKTSVEGTLFVYSRSASPINGFMILNRLGLNDLIEPINKNLEFQLQDPFLLYRNEKASIYGIWFYDKDECARIGQLMNSLVQVAAENLESRDNSVRQRRASESDTMMDRSLSSIATGGEGVPGGGGGGRIGPRGNVDILQMLSKAQDEYDKSKPNLGPAVPKTEPKQLVDNTNISVTKSSDLIKPRPLKGAIAQGASTGDTEVGGGAASSGATAGASGAPEPAPSSVNTLEKLFRQASLQQEPISANVPVSLSSSTTGSQMPPLLQRLMSNPGTTVAEIERQQRGEIPRDQMPKPVGEEAPPDVINGAPLATMSGIPQKGTNSAHHLLAEEPDSPNTALKRSLNILPPLKPKDVNNSNVSGVGTTHDSLLRTSKAPSLFGQNVPLPSHPYPTQASNSSPISQGVSAPSTSLRTSVTPTTGASLSMAPLGQGVLDPGGLSRVFPHSAPMQPSPALGHQTSTVEKEDLITPQAILQHCAASLPCGGSGGHPQGSSARTSQGANILLSPMVFQTTRVTPPISHVQIPTGADMLNVKSVSPQTLDMAAGRASKSPTAPSPPSFIPGPNSVTPLNKQQLQQALVYLIKNDGQFLNSLHEAYVKSLNIELGNRGNPGDRS